MSIEFSKLGLLYNSCFEVRLGRIVLYLKIQMLLIPVIQKVSLSPGNGVYPWLGCESYSAINHLLYGRSDESRALMTSP